MMIRWIICQKSCKQSQQLLLRKFCAKNGKIVSIIVCFGSGLMERGNCKLEVSEIDKNLLSFGSQASTINQLEPATTFQNDKNEHEHDKLHDDEHDEHNDVHDVGHEGQDGGGGMYPDDYCYWQLNFMFMMTLWMQGSTLWCRMKDKGVLLHLLLTIIHANRQSLSIFLQLYFRNNFNQLQKQFVATELARYK